MSSFQATCAFSEEKLTIFRAILSTKDSLKRLIFPFGSRQADKSSNTGIYVYCLNCSGYEFWVLPSIRPFKISFIKIKIPLCPVTFYTLTPICGILSTLKTWLKIRRNTSGPKFCILLYNMKAYSEE